MLWRTLALSTAVTTAPPLPSLSSPPPAARSSRRPRRRPPSQHEVPRQGRPGHHATWTEADKTGFGTARSRGSNVWFTLQQGRTSEVFYPDLSTPSVRSLELVVTGARLHRPRVDRHAAPHPAPGRAQPAVPRGQHRQAGALPDRRDVRDRPRAATRWWCGSGSVSLDGGRYRLYALYDPSLGNSGMDDRGRTAGDRSWPPTRAATVASALVARPRFGATSTGYLGTSDGVDRPAERPAPRPPLRPGRAGQHRPDRPDHRRDRPAPATARARLTLGFGTDAAAARRTAGHATGTALRRHSKRATTTAGTAGSAR